MGILTFFLFFISPFVFKPLPTSMLLNEAKPVLIFFLVLGVGFGVAAYFLVSRPSRVWAIVSSIIIVVLLGLYFLFWASGYGGQITYARFGFTVYRFIPIPYFDIKIGESGLQLRRKSHLITTEEIANLRISDIHTVVVGIGWNGAAKVEEGARNFNGLNVIVLPTPKAIELFNRLMEERKPAGLILHSTC